MILLSSVAAALIVGAVVLGLSASRDLLLHRRLKANVVLELKSGETFRGVLAAVDGRTVVLRNVEALMDGPAANMTVDGELLVPRGDVKFLQRP